MSHQAANIAKNIQTCAIPPLPLSRLISWSVIVWFTGAAMSVRFPARDVVVTGAPPPPPPPPPPKVVDVVDVVVVVVVVVVVLVVGIPQTHTLVNPLGAGVSHTPP